MRKRKPVIGIVILLLLATAGLLTAQQVSQKRDIAIFRLGYYRWNIPDQVLGNIDEEIKGVFINIGRFNVIGMNQRFEERDISEFIDKIKQYKQANVEIPKEVQMGQEFFTEADLDRLVGSFMVVVPVVSNFTLERKRNRDYEAVVKTTFTFINVEEGRAVAHATVETNATDAIAEKAASEAVNGIPLQLTYEIRKIAEYQIKTGVLEVRGGEVIVELGRDMGIQVGDEYALLDSRVLASGKVYTSEKGLIIIREVSDEVSVGRIIYADERLEVGDQLREIPRLGFDATPYVHIAFTNLDEDAEITALAGVRITPIRGFFDFKPLVGIEIPFIRNIFWGIPFNIYVGGEYDLYLGRLQVVPMAAFGFGGAYLWYLKDVEGQDFFFSHIGGQGSVSLTYLVSRDIRLTAEAGYLYWYSLDPTSIFFDKSLLFQSYGGPFLGAGVNIRY